jgi:hypothetical protein
MTLIISIIILTICSAILYRLGGTKAGTLYRDIGVSACLCAALSLVAQNWGIVQVLAIVISFGLQWAALSSYRYWLKKPENYSFKHYSLHGLMVALAAFPFALLTHHWLGFGIRCIVCAAGVGLWSAAMSRDWLDEGGRGAILCGTVPFLYF